MSVLMIGLVGVAVFVLWTCAINYIFMIVRFSNGVVKKKS